MIAGTVLYIQPAEDRGYYISDGAYLIGEDEAGMDSMFAGINQAVGQVQELLASMNSIVGNEGFRTSILQMMANLRDTTKHLSGLIAVLEQTAAENRGNVHEITANLVTLTASMNRTMGNVEHMMANLDAFAGDPATTASLRLLYTSLQQQHILVARNMLIEESRIEFCLGKLSLIQLIFQHIHPTLIFIYIYIQVSQVSPTRPEPTVTGA